MSEIKQLEKKLDESFEKFDERFEKIDERFEKMDGRFDELTALMSNFANDVNARFEKIDARFDQQDVRFDRIEAQLREQNEKYDHLVSTIDGFIARIDAYEVENAALGNKVDRLERWIQKLADEANITLST